MGDAKGKKSLGYRPWEKCFKNVTFLNGRFIDTQGTSRGCKKASLFYLTPVFQNEFRFFSIWGMITLWDKMTNLKAY